MHFQNEMQRIRRTTWTTNWLLGHLIRTPFPARLHTIKDVIIYNVLRRAPLSAQPTFSQRHGLLATPEIKFHDGLPPEMRQPIFDMLRRYTNRAFLWERIEWVFNRYGISQYPSGPPIAVSKEEDHPDTVAAKRVLMNCDWFRVYDLIEDIYAQLNFHEQELATEDEEPRTGPLQDELNAYFRYAGIGWQLKGGQIISRGDDAYEIVLREAAAALDASGRPTAHSHLQEARQALSRRPKPNLSGAVYHAMGSLEAVARDLSGTPKATLGEILKKHDIVPKPLDAALSQMWGYASNEARHVEEGREPTRDEAELVVGIAAAMVTYLSKKAG